MKTIDSAHVHTDITIFKVAGVTATGLITLFLLMRLLHLHTIVELRFLNIFIILFGIRYILLHQRNADGGNLFYLHGIMLGFITSLITAAFFSSFLFIYLNVDKNFMNFIMATQPFGSYLNPATTAMETMIEDSASGAILSFTMIHVFNRDRDAG